MLHVLFVCTGNICRSPMAQGLLEYYLRADGLDPLVTVDSAGTHASRPDAAPSSLALTVASHRGLSITQLRARRIESADFARADYILAMDSHNLQALNAMAPVDQAHKVHLLLEFADVADGEIADPYGATLAAYETAFKEIDRGVRGLLPVLRERLTTISVDGR